MAEKTELSEHNAIATLNNDDVIDKHQIIANKEKLYAEMRFEIIRIYVIMRFEVNRTYGIMRIKEIRIYVIMRIETIRSYVTMRKRRDFCINEVATINS